MERWRRQHLVGALRHRYLWMMKRARYLLLALVIVGAACSSQTETADRGSGATALASGEVAAGQPGGSLFVIDAASGTTEPGAGGTTEIALVDVSPQVVSFTDRPARSVATETPEEFVERWTERGFAEDPPNAALTVGEDVAVVILTDPAWDADTETMTMTATVLDPASPPAAGRPATISELPANLAMTSVFVDPSSAPRNTTTAFFTIRGTPTGAASPNVQVNNVMASPTEETRVGVEGGDADVTSTSDGGTFITYPGDQALDTTVTISIVPDADGTVRGEAIELDGLELTGFLVNDNGPGETVTISDGEPFTLVSKQ